MHKDETLGRWLVESNSGFGPEILVKMAYGEYVWERVDSPSVFGLAYYQGTVGFTVTEIHLAEGENMKIDEALEKTREQLNLCGEFDTEVKKARAMTDVPLLTALELVANRRGRPDVFKAFKKNLNAPDLDLPEIGRWIKATTEDGKTHVFEVEEHFQTGRGGTRLTRRMLPGTFKYPIIGEVYATNNVVKWEYTDEPYVVPEAPENGEYVRVTFHDGSTAEGEVKYRDRIRRDFESMEVGPANRWAIFPVSGERFDYYSRTEPESVVVKVEKIQRPWKVGDVVPARTVVGKRWLGRDGKSLALCDNGVNGVKNFTTDRKIEWIEDTK